MFGSTVTRAVHTAHVPVLVARRAPWDAPFPTRVLVGAEGSGNTESAIATAMDIARVFGSRITLLGFGGEAHRRLAEEAAREHASLIIVGSRALSGVRALASTSERVAHEAPCSVLVLRPA